MTASSEQIKCFLCGNTGKQPQGFSMTDFPQSLSRDDEIQVTQGEIQRTDDLIQKLSKHRAALQRRLNARRSIIYKLPSEVLRRIFEILVPNEHNLSIRGLPDSASFNKVIHDSSLPLYPQLLGKVSYAWRQLTVEMPKLWSTMIIRLSLPSELRCANALELFLRHSGNLPFHIQLEIWSGFASFRSQRDLLRSVEDIIFRSQHSSRFKTLHFISAPWKWFSLIGATSLPSLSSFKWKPRRKQLYRSVNPGPDDFDHDHEALADSALDRVPSLRRVILSDFSASFRLPLSVTILDLNGVSIKTCLILLAQCTKLEEFRYTPHERLPYRGTTNPPLNSISLPSLRVFEWLDVPVNLWAIFDRFRLPVVEMLTLRFTTTTSDLPETLPRPTGATSPHLFSFFSRLPQSLRELNLKNCHFSTEEFEQILCPLSGVEVLMLSGGLDNWTMRST